MRCAAPLAELVGHRTRRGVPCRRLRTGTPMDRRRMAVWLSGAAAFVPLYAPQSLLPLLREFVGNSPAMAGAVVSAGTAGVAIAAPLVGRLADRLGRRQDRKSVV